ncbi:rhodanese-like domain-containing protein [Desertibacillus haloalkaliphilus]|uniref:rhodanese-like domain-containing protein n=1 Tax=Desertibacillus haloalkaliphilus TaxID=1328930 RepID=UPI001C261575|nr:rhodanese-like domain-containing protein [Desertibacillus haloalkaliphilus]MBU8908706.1 rhodanese-like domain-containing protein [Desertibacillus haloalkaliphilus]
MDAVINGVLFLLVVLFIVNRFLPVKGVTQISTQDLKTKLRKKDVQFIDVRTPGEYTRNHIKTFENIPLHELAKNAKLLSKEKEVVVICQSGMRSTKATKVLKKLGFQKITNVKGGMSAWR